MYKDKITTQMKELKTREEVARIFGLPFHTIREIKLIFALLEILDWGRKALVIFTRDGLWFEVQAVAHGIKGVDPNFTSFVGQWEPEETTLEDLLFQHEAHSICPGRYYEFVSFHFKGLERYL